MTEGLRSERLGYSREFGEKRKLPAELPAGSSEKFEDTRKSAGRAACRQLYRRRCAASRHQASGCPPPGSSEETMWKKLSHSVQVC